MLLRVQRDAVGNGARNIVLTHDAFGAVARLQTAAVAAAMIDEVNPGGLGVRLLRVVEYAVDELREFGTRGHVVRLVDGDVLRDRAAGNRIRLGA